MYSIEMSSQNEADFQMISFQTSWGPARIIGPKIPLVGQKITQISQSLTFGPFPKRDKQE